MFRSKHLFRFTLGTLLMAVAGLAVCLGLLTRNAKKQVIAAKALFRSGAVVWFDTDSRETVRERMNGESPYSMPFDLLDNAELGRRDLLRRWLGRGYADRISGIQFGAGPELEKNIAYARSELDDGKGDVVEFMRNFDPCRLPCPSPSNAEWKTICSLKTIQGVYLGGFATDAALAHVCQIPNLKEVTIASPLISRDGLQALKNAHRVARVNIVLSDCVDRSVMRTLAGMPALERIDFCKLVTLHDEDLRILATAPKLVCLHEAKFDISDRGLKTLSAFEAIRSLDLSGNNKITDAGLQWISDMDVVDLDLRSTNVTDEGVIHLSKMPWLDELYVDDQEITKDGLALLDHESTVVFVTQAKRVSGVTSRIANGPKTACDPYRLLDRTAVPRFSRLPLPIEFGFPLNPSSLVRASE